MNPEEQKKYIKEQRALGVPDTQILQAIKAPKPVAPQRGFAGEILPTAFSVGGGIIGGIAGSAVAPGPGTVGGSIAGAGVGGAIGETIQQGIEKKFGQREEFNPGQAVGTGVVNAGLEATGAIFAKFAKPAFQASKPTLVRWISKMSGYADNVLEKALQRTPGAIQGVKEGESALVDVVKKTAGGISKFAKETVAESKAKIAEFSEKSVRGALPGTKQNLLDDSLKYTSRVVEKLRSDFNIGVDNAGQLIFDRARNMSNIVSGGDKSAIQEAFNAIQTIAKNPDIKHIDSVLERLITLRSKTPVGAPTGAETRAIISSMSDSVIDWVKSVPKGYGQGYAEYAKFLEQNLPKRILIGDAKEIFGATENLSPKEVSQIEKRLLQLYNTGNLEVREFAEQVGQEVGTDITGTSAGTLINTGDQVSVRAKNLTARGAVEKVIEFLPREIVQNYIATGNITGELGTTAKILAKVLGVTEKAILTEIANLMSNKTTE